MVPIRPQMTQRTSVFCCVSIALSNCNSSHINKKWKCLGLTQCCFCVCVSVSSGVLSVVMGVRYKRSGKLMPAGIITGLRSDTHTLLNGKLRICWETCHKVRWLTCAFSFYSLFMVFRLLLLFLMWPKTRLKASLSLQKSPWLKGVIPTLKHSLFVWGSNLCVTQKHH